MGYLKNELTGFVPVEQATEIIKMVTRGSSVLRMAKVEEMKHEKKKFNVLTDGPGAYWVGEGERIRTSGATWIHPEIEAKKLAVIIPVTKEKLEDTTISVFEELKPEIAEAFYRAIDAACIFGTNSPFKTNIMNAIDSKHMVVIDNTNIDIAISDAMSIIEENGYDRRDLSVVSVLRICLENCVTQTAHPHMSTVQQAVSCTVSLSNLCVTGRGTTNVPILSQVTSSMPLSVCVQVSITKFLPRLHYKALLTVTVNRYHLQSKDMVAIKATMRLGFLVVNDDAFAAFKNGVPTLGELTVESVAGTTGNTVITVSPKPIGGHKLVYKTAASTAPSVAYDDDLSKWTEFNNGDEITATNGHKITVAEVTADGKARKSGSADVVSGE